MKKKLLKLIAVIVVFAMTGCNNSQNIESSTTLEESQSTIVVVEHISEPTMVTTTEPTVATTTEATTEQIAEVSSETVEIDYSEIKPNEIGEIPIIMYHAIVEGTPPSVYQRSVEGFNKDLLYLYENNYRLISMEDYLNNNITVEAGCTPVILTFDDGLSGSFSLIEQDGELIPKTNCAVDLINKFTEEHPDFGKAAVFHMNVDNDPFKGAGTLKQRLQYLIDNGYEIGNHLYSHIKLSTLTTAEEVQSYIGRVDKLVGETIPGYKMLSIAYPHGIRPIEELRSFVNDGVYEGVEYHYAVGLREGVSSSASAINNNNFDPYNVPRVRGSEGNDWDMWWCFENYYPKRRYISDGDPDRISVPKAKEESVNKESLNGKELYLY